MHWHAEPSTLVLRGYPTAGGYERREDFIAVAGAKFIGPGRVFIEGALRVDGRPLSLADWRALATMLAREHGVHTVRAIRRGQPVEYPTARWMQQ